MSQKTKGPNRRHSNLVHKINNIFICNKDYILQSKLTFCDRYPNPLENFLGFIFCVKHSSFIQKIQEAKNDKLMNRTIIHHFTSHTNRGI